MIDKIYRFENEENLSQRLYI